MQEDIFQLRMRSITRHGGAVTRLYVDQIKSPAKAVLSSKCWCNDAGASHQLNKSLKQKIKSYSISLNGMFGLMTLTVTPLISTHSEFDSSDIEDQTNPFIM